MKKFSILSLAMLLVVGAGYAGRPTSRVGDIVIEVNKPQYNQLNAPRMADEVLGNEAVKKISKKAPIVEDEVSNLYVWSKQDVLQGKGLYAPGGSLDMVLVDAETGLVEITGWLPGLDLKAIGVVDYEVGTLSIPNYQEIGEDEYGPLYFYLKPYEIIDGKGYILDGVAEGEASVGYFDGNAFQFDDFDIWTIGDPDYEASELMMTYANLLTSLDEVQEGMWETVGECTVEDAWVTPLFQFQDGTRVNPSEFPFTAELQRNVENENIYRVWRPYHAEDWIVVDQNDSQFDGQIVFDITDPEHVIVKAGYYAGFGEPGFEMCVFGMLGWQIHGYGDAWSQEYLPMLYEFMEKNGQPFDTFIDNVLTVNLSVFDENIACENAYTWNDNPYVVSKITFPAATTAVSNVEVENAPVKYYNLQGVEVSNPAAGELVICRQGGKATKKIMK